MSELHWHDLENSSPTERRAVLLTGPSGYRGPVEKFVVMGYFDEKFRPRGDGPIRWLMDNGDELSDFGWIPTHWRYPEALP